MLHERWFWMDEEENMRTFVSELDARGANVWISRSQSKRKFYVSWDD